MLFDIFNYNVTLALFAFAFFLVLFLFLFRRYITSVADPLVFHVLWLTSQAAFFVIYAERNSVGIFYVIFVSTLIMYVVSLLIFFPIYKRRKMAFISAVGSLPNLSVVRSKKHWGAIVALVFLMFLYSNIGFFEYALTCRSPAELFLYKYVDLQGRNPTERILGVSSYFLLFFAFYGYHKKIHKRLAVFVIFIILMLAIVSGGRSALLGLVASVGTYIFYFSHEFKSKTLKRINRISVFVIGLAVLLAVYVTSFYEVDGTFENGLLLIFNRIFAAPDGIEYYLNHYGQDHIKMGPWAYFLSVFGIYVKNIFGLSYKNIGWQLTELVGPDVEFSQGANYTVLLQAVVFNFYIAPIYAVVVAWAVARLRYLYTVKLPVNVLVFVISSLSFIVATDLEYFTLLLISVVVVYVLGVATIARVRL